MEAHAVQLNECRLGGNIPLYEIAKLCGEALRVLMVTVKGAEDHLPTPKNRKGEAAESPEVCLPPPAAWSWVPP